MVSRTERTIFGAWLWTIDKLMLAALSTLMLAGIVLSLAASPPVAARLGLEPFYFVNRHVMFLAPALLVLIATSFLPPRQIRRLALVVFAVSLVLVALTLWYGAEVKGARRWITLLGISVLKPAFVILISWLFGESVRRPEMPANTVSLALLLGVLALLVLQPDFGQAMLIALVWGALFFMAGMRIVWVAGLAGTAVVWQIEPKPGFRLSENRRAPGIFAERTHTRFGLSEWSSGALAERTQPGSNCCDPRCAVYDSLTIGDSPFVPSPQKKEGPLARSGPIEPRGRSGAIGEGRKCASPT